MVNRGYSYSTSIRGDSAIVKTKDRVVINVGGTRHECYLSTIQNFPDTRLYWIAETAKKMVDFDPDRNEFFFDRHPGCFQNILNYCRTGKLHCPNDVCGPLFEQELGFWGVDELMMEPCCWGNYTQHREAHRNLKMFEKICKEEPEENEFEEFDRMQANKVHRCRGIEILMALRKYIWNIMEKPFYTRHAQIYALISMGIIILSILTFCLQTMKYFSNRMDAFQKMEYFYCVYFTLEFVIRIACCPSLKVICKSAMTWIDLISTMQFYYNFFTHRSTLDFLFVSRLIRIFRLFRFFKNLSGMQVIGKTLKSSAQELGLLVILMCIPMLIFSTLMYYAEQSNPKKTFPDIPSTCWWAIITMTTVGYGDDVPESVPGKLVGIMCSFCGVLIVALPVSVIGSNFTLYYSYAQARMRLPKRQSPALVSADKALMNDGMNDACQNTEPNEAREPPKSQPNGSIPHTLHGLAEVMVDITVPTMERRHAILPRITPILHARNRRKGMATRISSKNSSIDSTTVPMLTQSNFLETDQRDKEEMSAVTPPRSRKTSRNRMIPLSSNLRSFLSTTTTNVGDNASQEIYPLSKSDETRSDFSLYHQGDYDFNRKKRSLHVDITQYKPRKLSRDEQKLRQKLSQGDYLPLNGTSPNHQFPLKELNESPENEVAPKIQIDEDNNLSTNNNTSSLVEERNVYVTNDVNV